MGTSVLFLEPFKKKKDFEFFKIYRNIGRIMTPKMITIFYKIILGVV